MPGTPSRHLFDDATSASNWTSRASMGRAPKELIASTSNERPCSATTRATSASGFNTPEVVSQCTRATCEMLGSLTSRSWTLSASTGSSSRHSSVSTGRRIAWHIATMRRP